MFSDKTLRAAEFCDGSFMKSEIQAHWLQGVLTLFWRVAVGVLGVLIAAVAYSEPVGKPVVRQVNQTELEMQVSDDAFCIFQVRRAVSPTWQ